jgi:glutathione synthase/RimK-type ligase-like ATP-grasp enzyme
MSTLIVVNNPNDWPLDLPGVELVSARSYLTNPVYSDQRGAKVFNLCRSYRYQSFGYYVSLLAAARSHKVLPSITTIQDLKLQSMIRLASDDLDELIQRSLDRITGDSFELSIYFGRNIAKRYERLSLALFNLFPAPLMRAKFMRSALRAAAADSANGNGQAEREWQLTSVQAIPASEIPKEHWLFMLDAVTQYFITRQRQRGRPTTPRFDLAILTNPEEDTPPSDEKAIERFSRAAKSVGFRPELITRDDFGRLAEFEALFIRETTAVNHHTYRFARRAAAEGLVVIDDPESIVRCTNKVYLAELLERHEIGCPRTLIVHKDNVSEVPLWVGFPCVLKQPDGSFSRGVVKVTNEVELQQQLEQMLEKSDLVIAQGWLPSDFDWRIGVLDRKPIYVCKYHMAKGHWQIRDAPPDGSGNERYGRVETIPVEAAPRRVIHTALRAANLIGDGLYGVDLKQVKGRCYVIEVNDNPSIDAGYEDKVLKQGLYERIMQVLYNRTLAMREGPRPTHPRPAAPIAHPAD